MSATSLYLWDDNSGLAWHHRYLRRDAYGAFPRNFAHSAACCCAECVDCNCCAGLETVGTGYTISPHDCRVAAITANLVFGTQYELTDTVGAGWFSVECLESADDTPGVVHLRLTAWMAISCACVYNWTQDVYLDCLPLDYTFTLHTEEGAQPPSEGCPGPNHCCGDIVIRIFSYDCTGLPDRADCLYCHFCLPTTLQLNATPADPLACPDIHAALDVPLTFTGDCAWESALVCLNEATGCCYRFVFRGTRANNRWCDWRLSIYDGSDAPVVEDLANTGFDTETLRVTFANILFPCCPSTPVTVVVSDLGM